MYDVRITDDLTASAADLRFVSVSKISGSGPWTPVNTGTDTNLVIEDPTGGIDIPAGEQVVVEITVVLENTPTNVAGLTFTNTADFTYNRSRRGRREPAAGRSGHHGADDDRRARAHARQERPRADDDRDAGDVRPRRPQRRAPRRPGT